MKKTLLILAAVLIAAFTLNCCGKLAEKALERGMEKAIEKESGGKVDIDIGGKTASNLPSELVYPGAKKSQGSLSLSGSGDQGAVSWVYFESDGSFAGIKGYYGTLKSKGWTKGNFWESTDDEGKQTCQYIYSKGDKKVIITLIDEGDNRNIAIWYGSEN